MELANKLELNQANNKLEINKKFKTEIIRLIAPLLGCTYDDLKQRHKERQVKRRYDYKKEVKHAKSMVVSKHKCAICGRNSEDNPDAEFRFCSKCNGNYEYCQEHLFTHTHVK